MATPLRIPCRLVRVPRAGPWLRQRVGLFTVASAFAFATTVMGADILADRLSDRRHAGSTMVQLGSLTTPLTLGSTADETRRFNVSDEFALLSGAVDASWPAIMRAGQQVTSAGLRATLLSVRVDHRGRSDRFSQFNGAQSGDAVGGVDCSDGLAPTEGPLFVLRWTRAGEVVRLALPRGGVGIDHHGS